MLKRGLMGKWKRAVLAVIFFLTFEFVFLPAVSAINFPLTQIKVDDNCPDKYFKKIYDSVCMGLAIYKSDVLDRCSKEEIIGNLCRIVLDPAIRFDLNNIDIVRKGWTRYYPFSIDGKDFIMRIFLTDERFYQPSAPILYEGSIANPAVTFQVLPSLSEILADCKIKPPQTYSTRQVDGSS